MRILVCGGAGYIGAHMVKCLAGHGHEITVFDNLASGHRAAVQWGTLVVGDVLDRAALDAVFALQRHDAVMHFCARSLVGESVVEPYACYRNNVVGTLTLLEAMRAAGVDRIVFSSTAAVFGNPVTDPIDEDHPTAPINPYGASKRMCERLLEDAAAAYGLRAVALRYFNAAGADPAGRIGESHQPETHLIPNVLRAVLGQGPALKVFGDDYPTRDGTCVRDYVHVDDLAAAHLAALALMADRPGFHAFNLGNGTGFSVREVIAAAERVSGRRIECASAPRRAGDPPTLVASGARAREQLGWRPRYSELDAIIETAWRWHRAPAY
ncbi:MAG: UDP-glucose 4-epimerase GalE [Xanthomonadaceae bacterium]|nr:UDP-glucose 4-epimerase GalE [Xanthomonadaceae bacterium]